MAGGAGKRGTPTGPSFFLVFSPSSGEEGCLASALSEGPPAARPAGSLAGACLISPDAPPGLRAPEPALPWAALAGYPHGPLGCPPPQSLAWDLRPGSESAHRSPPEAQPQPLSSEVPCHPVGGPLGRRRGGLSPTTATAFGPDPWEQNRQRPGHPAPRLRISEPLPQHSLRSTHLNLSEVHTRRRCLRTCGEGGGGHG